MVAAFSILRNGPWGLISLLGLLAVCMADVSSAEIPLHFLQLKRDLSLQKVLEPLVVAKLAAGTGCESNLTCSPCGQQTGCTWCPAVVTTTDKAGKSSERNLGLGVCVDDAANCDTISYGSMAEAFDFPQSVLGNLGSVSMAIRPYVVGTDASEWCDNTNSTTPTVATVIDCSTCIGTTGQRWFQLYSTVSGFGTKTGGVCMDGTMTGAQLDLSPLTDLGLQTSFSKDFHFTGMDCFKTNRVKPPYTCSVGTDCRSCQAKNGCVWCGGVATIDADGAEVPVGVGACVEQEGECESTKIGTIESFFKNEEDDVQASFKLVPFSPTSAAHTLWCTSPTQATSAKTLKHGNCGMCLEDEAKWCNFEYKECLVANSCDSEYKKTYGGFCADDNQICDASTVAGGEVAIGESLKISKFTACPSYDDETSGQGSRVGVAILGVLVFIGWTLSYLALVAALLASIIMCCYCLCKNVKKTNPSAVTPAPTEEDSFPDPPVYVEEAPVYTYTNTNKKVALAPSLPPPVPQDPLAPPRDSPQTLNTIP